jgi:hypothetical protein
VRARLKGLGLGREPLPTCPLVAPSSRRPSIPAQHQISHYSLFRV